MVGLSQYVIYIDLRSIAYLHSSVQYAFLYIQACYAPVSFNGSQFQCRSHIIHPAICKSMIYD